MGARGSGAGASTDASGAIGRRTEPRVVATAGHVDHGKSSLIVRLTGIDPDRWAEEKRRGLTIDLGYAWCELPSGREIGFVDVPGHERFVANMLAGVGPVRLVLFVVAANEGWRRQSEEHLAILDLLGIDGGVIALTKIDLVDDVGLELAIDDVRQHVAGTPLERAALVPVSAATGAGLDELRAAIDAIVAAAPAPEKGRPRLFVDRSFTIGGAGTVVTGTLGGGCVAVGDEVEVYPVGRQVRIRALQSHERGVERACPISRVAMNLAGIDRTAIGRGDVLGPPGAWRPTTVLEATLRPVRGLGHAITARGAYKVHAGAAEADAKLRILGRTKVEDGEEAFVRITLARPLVLDVFDRYVLRESGRTETVGGGTVLDVEPPRRAGPTPEARLARRATARRAELPRILADERGGVRVADAAALTGVVPEPDVDGWLLREGSVDRAAAALVPELERHHREHPREAGAPIGSCRAIVVGELGLASGEAELADALLGRLAADGRIERTANAVRLPTHRVHLGDDDPDVRRLLEALGSPDPTQPPSLREIQAAGIGRDVVDAAVEAGVVVRVAPDLAFVRPVIERAEAIVAAAGSAGITVSAFREALGTSRKYALPLLAWFDQRGITRRQGDLRFPRA
jgi:selenocysteine-specific elongation factor